MSNGDNYKVEAMAKEFLFSSEQFSPEEQNALWKKMSTSDQEAYRKDFRRVMHAGAMAAVAAETGGDWISVRPRVRGEEFTCGCGEEVFLYNRKTERFVCPECGNEYMFDMENKA